MIKPFSRFSAFHSFLEFVIDDLLTDTTGNTVLEERRETAERHKGIPEALADVEPFILPIEHALRHHNFEFETFCDWLETNEKSFSEADEDDIYEYLNDLRLCGPYHDLLIQCVREVFFVLFGNRHLLMLFNNMIGRRLSDTTLDEVSRGIPAISRNLEF